MKSFKSISGFLVALVVIGAITMLVIKYFDLLAKMFDNIRSQVSEKKMRFFSDDCCDCCDEEYEEDDTFFVPEEVQ